MYASSGEAVSASRSGSRHSGVHVVAVHEARPKLMMARHFLTYQPAEHARLASCVMGVQHGRVLVVMGVPEWILFLGSDAENALVTLGSAWAAQAAQGEAWAWVGVVGGASLAEAVTTREMGRYPSTALLLDTFVTKSVAATGRVRCAWYSLPDRCLQAAFCERYEGYSDLCTCNGTFFPETRKLQESILTKESIPVVVVTANKPHHLYRVLRNLFSIPGAAQTEVLVAVDGAHQEALALTEVLGVGVVVHRPEGVGNIRTNANVRFALYSVFRSFPQADKAIVVEDDLLLSPDFLRYFHHVSPILDLDPTVFCVNAFSSNSFVDTASDPSVLLRARTYPMYGWMVSRAYSTEVLNNWVRPGIGDWDWWLTWEDLRKGRDVVFPEVSRTFHAGSAGIHVSGFEQEVYFNRMIYNNMSHVPLMDINLLVRARYEEQLRYDLTVASRQVIIPRDLCDMSWLTPNTSRPLLLYVYAVDDNDEHDSYKIFLTCFRTYDLSTREMYKGVMRVRWRGTVVYLVGCPFSPFCFHNEKNKVAFKPSAMDLQQASLARDAWENTFLKGNPRLAHHPALTSPLNLTHLVTLAAHPTASPPTHVNGDGDW
ncbi:protein O-linked-mannose beta-1,2-N-acetylglucosaminyltransferase 1-like [Procambarus clarkii]|uniref:protein O-linked-mannose beta-1,2-N-acetylglucosaminyltransferase 1-like n=1 Tax=Procambarus clarkii TaxID=6728 RepID=UPI0037444E3D